VPVVTAAGAKAGLKLEFERALVGGAAYDAKVHPLPEDTLALCDRAAAIYFGAVGGPSTTRSPTQPAARARRPPPLRKRYTLYANVRPAVVYKGLENSSPSSRTTSRAWNVSSSANSSAARTSARRS
jgi:3-isopropylmalate dehydrogenase